jgi:hypothetical protein
MIVQLRAGSMLHKHTFVCNLSGCDVTRCLVFGTEDLLVCCRELENKPCICGLESCKRGQMM